VEPPRAAAGDDEDDIEFVDAGAGSASKQPAAAVVSIV
jgi:hypothetical protein